MNKNNTGKAIQFITNGDMSGTITSSARDIRWQDNCSIQLNFIGTPTGTFNIQGSADYFQDQEGNIVNAGNWVNLVFTTPPVAAGGPGTVLLDMNQLSFPWVRVMYVPTSGTGSLNAFISTKVV